MNKYLFGDTITYRNKTNKENKMTHYTILHKKTGLFFAGFKNDKETWTSDKNLAWSDRKMIAVGQASLFRSLGINAQQKPVAV